MIATGNPSSLPRLVLFPRIRATVVAHPCYAEAYRYAPVPQLGLPRPSKYGMQAAQRQKNRAGVPFHASNPG